DDLSAGGRVLLSTARAVLADRIEDGLPLVEQSALVVYGDRDSFVSRAWAERAATLLPRGRLLTVSGEPHAVHYTQPELVAGLVRELVVQEGQHARRQLRRSLEHRNVSAMQVLQPDVGKGLPPLLGELERDEPVPLAPDQERRRANGRKLVSQVAAGDESDSAADVPRAASTGVSGAHRYPPPPVVGSPQQRQRTARQSAAAGDAGGRDEHESPRLLEPLRGQLGGDQPAEGVPGELEPLQG